MDLLLQQFANGISIGMSYALVALGLTLVFGVLHVVNFAHGEFYMLGALVVAVCARKLGLPYLATLPLAVLAAALLAFVMDRVAVRPVAAKPGGDRIVLVSTYAAGLIVVETVLSSLGPTPIPVTGFTGHLALGPVVITGQRLFMIVTGAILIAAVYLLLRFTSFGNALRAVAQSGYAAKVVGLQVESIKSRAFVLAGAIAGLAGALIVPVITFNATMGHHAGIHAFVVVVIGTMGSIPGAVICGLALGIIESVISIYISQDIAAALVYSLLLATLLMRPAGLFSRAAS